MNPTEIRNTEKDTHNRGRSFFSPLKHRTGDLVHFWKYCFGAWLQKNQIRLTSWASLFTSHWSRRSEIQTSRNILSCKTPGKTIYLGFLWDDNLAYIPCLAEPIQVLSHQPDKPTHLSLFYLAEWFFFFFQFWPQSRTPHLIYKCKKSFKKQTHLFCKKQIRQWINTLAAWNMEINGAFRPVRAVFKLPCTMLCTIECYTCKGFDGGYKMNLWS